jgi:hypothetical protein
VGAVSHGNVAILTHKQTITTGSHIRAPCTAATCKIAMVFSLENYANIANNTPTHTSKNGVLNFPRYLILLNIYRPDLKKNIG